MAFGTLVVVLFLVGVSVPDGFVEYVLIDRAVGMDRVLVLFVDLWVAGFAGGVFQGNEHGRKKCEQQT